MAEQQDSKVEETCIANNSSELGKQQKGDPSCTSQDNALDMHNIG